MSPWEIVKQIAGHIYTDEQIDEMTWAECAEIISQKEKNYVKRIKNNRTDGTAWYSRCYNK